MTLQQMQGYVAALNGIRGAGILTVEYNGRRTTFQSAADIAKSIEYYEGLIDGLLNPCRPRRRAIYTTSNKGL